MRAQDPFTLNDLFKSEWRLSLLSSLGWLGLAYVFEHFANVYAYAYSLRSTSSHVGDLVLDNIPVINLNFIIIEGALIAIVLGIWLVFSKPRYVLFTLKALALFIAVRAVFVSLTHVGIYPDSIAPGLGFFDSIYLYLNFQTGLFFSGHTGLPFLMALIFWQNARVRYALLALSFIDGIAVLVSHIHYSIDVFAAPFMAFGIYHLARRFFRRDHRLIEHDPVYEG